MDTDRTRRLDGAASRRRTEPVRRPETVLVPVPPPAPPPFGLTGEPPAPRRSRRALWAVLAGAVVVVLAVVGGVVVLAGGPGVDGPAVAAPPPPVGAGPPAVAPPPVASAAQGLLDDRVRADAAAVEALLDRWVAQLYAERAGSDAAAERVLRGHAAATAATPGALLLSSTDLSSFELDGYYVVVAPTPFATAAEALAWCTAQDLDRDGCFAKRLSRTAGPAGATVYQG